MLDICKQVARVLTARASVIQVHAATAQVNKLLALFLKVLDCLDKCIKSFAAATYPDDKVKNAIIC